MAKILIVEDEKNMQEIIAEYLRRGGHTCFTADDGMDALLVLKSNPMDLLILDIMMPGMNGLEMCKKIRYAVLEQTVHIHVVHIFLINQ